MSATNDVWYHGTRTGFRSGGYLFPRTFHNRSGTTAPLTVGRTQPASATDWVYVTQSPILAWVYAWHATGSGKPKVLIVEPYGAIEHDPEHSPRMEAWRTEWARVTAVLTEPAITEREARDGWVS